MGLGTIENGINSQNFKILNENPEIHKLCVLLYESIPSHGLEFKIPKGKFIVFEKNFSTTYHIF
jgi:hypothetical protein